MITHDGLTYSPTMAAKICIQFILINTDWDTIVDQCFPELTQIERIGVITRLERMAQLITIRYLRITAREQGFKRYKTLEQHAEMQRKALATRAEKRNRRETVLKQKYREELKLEEEVKLNQKQSECQLQQAIKQKIKSDPFVKDPAFSVDSKEESEEMF